MFAKKSPRLIFIVDDNSMYAKTLKAFLSMRFTPATTIETFPVGELCVDDLKRKPDVVIMDYCLNSKFYDAANGLDVAKQVKATNPATEVIMLSGQNDIAVVLNAVEKVHCNYVIKNENAFEKVSGLISGVH